MATFGELFGLKTFELAEKIKTKNWVSTPPVAELATSQSSPSVALSTNLESCYKTDPIAFNGVNFVRKIVTAEGYIIGPDTLPENIISFYNEWLKRNEMENLMPEILTHLLVYGNCYLELLPPKGGPAKRIVAVKILDPKTIEYQKDLGSDVIIVDEYGYPVGYIQKLIVPTTKDTGTGNTMEIKIPAEKILHFKLFVIGNGYTGIGLLEPILTASIRRMNIEEGLAESTFRTGFPIKMTYVGNEQHEPTTQEIDDIVKKLQTSDYNSVFGLPYYNKVEILEPKKLEKIKDVLDHFINIEVSGMGIPKPYVTGAGEETNRSTLASQTELFQKTVEMIQDRLSYYFNKLFDMIAAGEGFKEHPLLLWPPVSVQDLDSKSKRLVGYVQSGILTADDKLIKMVKESEGIPLIEGVESGTETGE